MAKARMLHKSISVSTQVDKLSLPAQLLFTWMIPHADDDVRLKGEPEYIKAIVVPMKRWSHKKIDSYLNDIKNVGLIHLWEQNSDWFVEFAKWNNHQQIRKDRRIPTKLPSYSLNNDNQVETKGQPEVTQKTAQYNIRESNKIEINKSEDNKKHDIADIYSYKKSGKVLNPKDFIPSNQGETVALTTWEALEPDNPFAFQSTYLKAYKRGLSANMFFTFTSEINQDPEVKNKGAIFNKKVDDHFNRKK